MLEPPVTVLAFQKLWLLRVAKEENHKKIQFFSLENPGKIELCKSSLNEVSFEWYTIGFDPQTQELEQHTK